MTTSEDTCISIHTAPSLAGYTLEPPRAIRARDNGKLLTIRLETSLLCNFNCLYCNNNAGIPTHDELSITDIRNILPEVRRLGAESVVLIGGGEPLLYPGIRDLTSFIHRAGMTPVIITNGFSLTEEFCSFFLDHNTSILLKCDSFDRNTQDRLAGKTGAHAAIMRSIDLLLKVYDVVSDPLHLRTGLSFVATRLNHDGILPIWKFCRENNLYPNLEEFIPRGRGLSNYDTLYLDAVSVHSLKMQLLTLDREQYGYDWILHSPLPGHGCLQPLCSVYITSTGSVRPCPDIDIPWFNVKQTSLSEIMATPFFKLARSVDKHLHGKCGACEYNPRCIGCRGNAFTDGVNRGLSPEEALCSPDPLCRKQSTVYDKPL